MNKFIFKREDFVLCYVPVPNGYPQSQTHAGLALSDGRYYLTTSPYPSPQYGLWEARIRKLLSILSFGRLSSMKSGEVYENPCIYIGEQRGNEIPTRFNLMQQSPLMCTPDSFFDLPSYNSDPEIYIENKVIHILNRCVVRTKAFTDKPYEFITRIYLIRGLDVNGHFKLLSNRLVLEGNYNYVSPSLIKLGNKYIVSFLDNRIFRHRVIFNNLFLSVSNSIECAIKAENRCSVMVKGDDLVPWHMSLFQHNGTIYSIVTCVKNDDATLRMWLMLGEFNKDLTELFIYSTPLTDFNSYRSAAYVREDGMFVLYNTTVWEKIKGSKSVDGRDIVMTHCKFATLLNQIRSK